MKTNVYYIPVQLGSNFREHAQEIPQEKIDTKNVLKIEDIIDIQNLNEAFSHNYLFEGETGRDFCFKYTNFIDPNYDEGYFFIIAARNGDTEMLNALIEKGNQENPNNTTNSIQEGLGTAAHKGYLDCVKLLIENGADPKKLIGYSSYDNHKHIKKYLDEKLLTK